MGLSNQEKISEIIFSGFANVPDDHIRAIIDAEIAKDEKDIDLNKLDVCFNVLECKNSNKVK